MELTPGALTSHINQIEQQSPFAGWGPRISKPTISARLSPFLSVCFIKQVAQPAPAAASCLCPPVIPAAPGAGTRGRQHVQTPEQQKTGLGWESRALPPEQVSMHRCKIWLLL